MSKWIQRKRLVVLYGLLAFGSLHAEPRTWTSISGSTIEALFLGEFGEDYWFEASEDGQFIKMPSKYISEADVKFVASGEVKGALPAPICDEEPASIQLLESIYTTKAAELASDTETLEQAVEQLLLPFQPKEAAEDAEEIEITFSKRRYKKIDRD